jgi:hypothetical protein
MNWKECGWTLLELDIWRDKGSFLEAVRKNTKTSVAIAGLPAEV